MSLSGYRSRLFFPPEAVLVSFSFALFPRLPGVSRASKNKAEPGGLFLSIRKALLAPPFLHLKKAYTERGESKHGFCITTKKRILRNRQKAGPQRIEGEQHRYL